jgi:amino acid adenylation domain-containing protein
MSRQFPAEDIEQSIAERFENQAAAYPERVAIRADAATVTYAELNAAANRLARTVLRVAPEARQVVLLFEQGASVLVAVLAVLKAGKTYVPLDPDNPPVRLAELLEDAQAGLIVTNGRYRAVAEGLATRPGLPVLDADASDSAESSDNLGLSIAPDAIAYMLYTSGSTGRPKGVVQRHRNLLHFVRSYTNTLGITPEDRIGWVHSITFSASNMNVYPALLNGATLCPYDVKTRGVGGLARMLMDERVTICQCVPTVFRHFLAGLTGEERFPDLRIWEVAGEPFHRTDVDLFWRHFSPSALLCHRLAFTEASVAAQGFITPTTDLGGGAVPIGRPAEGVEISLVDDAGREVPVGETGEIVLRSRYLSPGYWRRPDLTEAAFAPDPGDPQRRLYRTRDLGRYLTDGRLAYVGRRDFRVKISGYTIEVAEVEAALLGLGTIKQAVVTAYEDRRGDKRLIAYVVPHRGPAPSAGELREGLALRLPEYMVPAMFIPLDVLPVTSTGKVDRAQLPDPQMEPAATSGSYVAPRTGTEETMARIWAEVFRLDRVGINDDFFELGGHSLLAGQAVARIRRAFHVDMPLGTLFEAPTIAELCGRLGEFKVLDEGDRPVPSVRA